MSVGMCPLSNQLILLSLKYDKSVSGGIGVSVSDSEVSSVLGVVDVDPMERVVWLQIRRKKHHKFPFLVPQKPEKSIRQIFNIHMFYTQLE